MRIKVKPRDFIVTEVASIETEDVGDYALYLLTKENTTTWEALGKVAKHLHLPLSKIGYGGLKDKRSLSHQYVTIFQGPKRDLRFKGFQFLYLGQTLSSMNQGKVLGNLFQIVVREVEIRGETLEREIQHVKNYGIPNYFDEQRFGSIKGLDLEFPAKCIIKGEYERALKLSLTQASPDDVQKSKKLRECLGKNWRRWEECLPLARLSWERELLKFLTNHQPSRRTFKRALQLMDQDYLFFLGNVYQSYLWNETLKRVLQQKQTAEFKVPYPLGELIFYRTLTLEQKEELKELKIPLASPKLNLEKTPPLIRSSLLKTLEGEGFKDLKELRSSVKGLIFKTYPRPAITFPKDLSWERVGPKEVKLQFFLERGSYATLVVKRIFYAGANT